MKTPGEYSLIVCLILVALWYIIKWIVRAMDMPFDSKSYDEYIMKVRNGMSESQRRDLYNDIARKNSNKK